MNLKNKKVLITAGPTWVAIDDVRVISNKASGETGLLLAQKLAAKGAKIVLLLGPVGSYKRIKNVKILDFQFFEELERLLRIILRKNEFDFIIHSAAVSDFRPKVLAKGKINSNNEISLKLERTPKLISMFRLLNNKSKIVGFKFEVGISKKQLLKEAENLLKNNLLNAVVANTVSKNNRYQAFVMTGSVVTKALSDKQSLVKELLNYIGGGYE